MRCAIDAIGAVVATAVLSGGLSPTASAVEADPDRTGMVYSISAHPDDEFGTWGIIENRPHDYIVSVLATQGEQTTSCLTAAESPGVGDPGLANGTIEEGFGSSETLGIEGPYKYQGPSSPVGEPDKGERHPLGNPWRGQGTDACRDARVASWHWFLDDMAQLDSGLADMEVDGNPERDDDYQGVFCRTGSGCVKVWANRDGARVAFDLGDRGFPFEVNPDPLTRKDVARAVLALRAYREDWGLPVIAEQEIIATIPNPESDSDCPSDPHPDHQAVADALYLVNLGAGAQQGNTCPSSERYGESPGPADQAIDPDTLVAANLINPETEERLGAWVVNYGWLFGTYIFAGGAIPTYWERFAAAAPPESQLSLRPRSASVDKAERFRFRLTVEGVKRRIPVPDARIRFAGKRGLTNGRGRATINKRFASRGRRRAVSGSDIVMGDKTFVRVRR